MTESFSVASVFPLCVLCVKSSALVLVSHESGSGRGGCVNPPRRCSNAEGGDKPRPYGHDLRKLPCVVRFDLGNHSPSLTLKNLYFRRFQRRALKG